MEINEELRMLSVEIERKKHITAKMEALCQRKDELAEETSRLRSVMEIEAEDVKSLERVSVTSIFYTLIGQKVERLEKEKREAVIAAEKYMLANSELDTVLSDIEKCRKELRYIERCEEKYAELWDKTVKDKAAAIIEKGAEGEALSKRLAWLKSRIKETDEAIAEGNKVVSMAGSIVEKLNGYMIAYRSRRRSSGLSDTYEIQAHEKLKSADNTLLALQTEITRLKSELADIEIDFDGEAYNYALAYASNYYVNLFASLGANGGSAFEALESTEKLKSEVSAIVSNLEKRRKRLESDLLYTEEKINNFAQ